MFEPSTKLVRTLNCLLVPCVSVVFGVVVGGVVVVMEHKLQVFGHRFLHLSFSLHFSSVLHFFVQNDSLPVWSSHVDDPTKTENISFYLNI